MAKMGNTQTSLKYYKNYEFTFIYWETSAKVHLNDAARHVACVGLPKRIPFLSINEIGYRIWVGAVL